MALLCFQGDFGPPGFPGRDGFARPDGIPGVPGDNASIPKEFLRGEPGFPGIPGGKGPMGDKGGKGEPGESYPPPVINLKGEKGYKGERGDIGKKLKCSLNFFPINYYTTYVLHILY